VTDIPAADVNLFTDEALISRVERFEPLEHEVALNNTLRGFGSLKVRVS